jgi:hypothetical protein
MGILFGLGRVVGGLLAGVFGLLKGSSSASEASCASWSDDTAHRDRRDGAMRATPITQIA